MKVTGEKKVKIVIGVIISTIIILSFYIFTFKNSRSYIENRVSSIDRIYATENLEDLFKVYPSGFKISQSRISNEEDRRYSYNIEMIGDPNTKEIKGKINKELLNDSEKEEILKETNVYYTKGIGLELEDRSLTEEMLSKNYFLFQKITLNKSILSELEVSHKDYVRETGSYLITYNISGNKIKGLENFDKLSLTGEEKERTTYTNGIYLTKNNTNNNDTESYIEYVVELKQ